MANLDVLPDRAKLEEFYDPHVCRSCGFCCTSLKVLASHGKKFHPMRRKSSILKGGSRRSAIADREIGDLRPFATVVEDRVKDSFASELPPLCCTDVSKKPFAIYVPVYLTEAESDLLYNFSSALEGGVEASPDEEHLSRVVPQMNPLKEFGPQPIDVNILNEMFEIVRNEPELTGKVWR